MTPFDKDYVINRTIKNMRSAIEFSTKKTMMRNIDFQDEPDKQKEIMETLVELGRLHKLLEIYENPQEYEKDEEISR